MTRASISDITEKQFLAALERRHFKREGVVSGYVRIGGGYYVNYLNAERQTWRGRLAWLIKQERKRLQCTT